MAAYTLKPKPDGKFSDDGSRQNSARSVEMVPFLSRLSRLTFFLLLTLDSQRSACHNLNHPTDTSPILRRRRIRFGKFPQSYFIVSVDKTPLHLLGLYKLHLTSGER